MSSRRCKELWVVSGCNHQCPVNIEFAESGKDADWTIRQLGARFRTPRSDLGRGGFAAREDAGDRDNEMQ